MSENQDYHNQFGLYAFISSLTFVICFFIYIVFINQGVTLDEKIQTPAQPGAVAFDLNSVKNPWEPNPQVAEAGHKIFIQNCAACHGQKGDTVGGIPNARNLIEGQWKAGSGMIDHYKVLQNGLPGTQMVGFKQLKPVERWAIINWIQTITKNKSQDSAADIAKFAASAD